MFVCVCVFVNNDCAYMFSYWGVQWHVIFFDMGITCCKTCQKKKVKEKENETTTTTTKAIGIGMLR